MNTDFNEEKEFRLLEFIQNNYGMEVFTPGLSRTRPIYLPSIKASLEAGTKVSIIAGTNGKGQTAHTLAYLFETAKLSYGLWTSPHILSIRERFHFNGRNLSYEDLEEEISETHLFLKEEHKGLRISFYEFLFLVFLRTAFKNNLSMEHLILEVGLGGRLDAVNHFNADCACITSISRDHQAILGSRYDQILGEKIAVARKGKPLFTQFRLNYLNELTEKVCRDNGVLWRPLKIMDQAHGNYFEENKKLALELFTFLEPTKLAPDMDKIPHFKGRREEMTFRGNTLIFIGAHNIDGIRRMLELFSAQGSEVIPSKVLLSFSKRPANELDVMLATLVEFFGKKSKLLLTSFVHPKALDLNDVVKLENKINKINKGLLDFVTDWKTELNTSTNQKILVCGSYYFVGEVQRYILQSS